MFKKGEYVVVLKLDNYSGVCAKENYCFKTVHGSSNYLNMECDLTGAINGHGVLLFDKSKDLVDWRYATQEEVDEYELIGKPYDVSTLDNFILPEQWRLKITPETRDVINDWRKNIICYHFSNCQYDYIAQDGSGDSLTGEHPEITYLQFLKYVVHRETSKIKEDLNYLVEMFDKLNIR